MECEKGYKEENGKCVKENPINYKISKSYKKKITPNFGLIPSQMFGILLLIIGALVWFFRPAQECALWQIFCKAGGLISTPIFFIFTITLIGGGIFFLLKIDKLIFGK